MTTDSPVPTTSAVERAPVSLFAIVMGLAGLAIAWRRAHVAIGAPPGIGEALMACALFTWLVVLLIQLLRALRYPGVLVAEFRSPKGIMFVPTFSVSTALLAGGLTPYAKDVASALWIFAASLHLALAFIVVRLWFAERREIDEASPSWFIPVVGNLLMPVIGVPLGYNGVSWFLFAVGAMFWLILAPVMTWRLFFAAPLAEAAAPSIFILLAPPSVGALAVLALTGGEASSLTHVLFGFSAFVAALVASLLGKVLRTHFAIGWWALTFPTAAFATLSLTYAHLMPSAGLWLVGVCALAFASAIVACVAFLTVRAVSRGDLVPA